jgi:CheY-like chemotaxis protein
VIVYGTLNIRRLSSKNVPPGAEGRNEPGQEESAHAAGLVRKVLVVDDEADLADLADALLSSRGLEVVVANSAMEALQILARDGGIDAVFSDVMMPGMNGLQLADAVSEFYPRVKIVLTSGYTVPAMLEDRERRYLFTTKPYRIDTIMKLLRS